MGCDPEVMCDDCREEITAPPGRSTCLDCLIRIFGGVKRLYFPDEEDLYCDKNKGTVCYAVIKIMEHMENINHDMWTNPRC